MTDVPTIEDVAKKAGVSVATVSRALRGMPHVSPSTRARVKEIAVELDYQANPHAARLAARRSGTIGVALPILNSWFYGNVLAGIETAVSEDHLDLHLVTVDGLEALERFATAVPSLSKQVDGLVLIDVFMPDRLWSMLERSGLPIATVGVDPGVFDAVVIDNVAAARTAVAHLVDLGHEEIGFIGGGVDEALEFESGPLRLQGMVEAMEARCLRFRTDLSVPGGFSVQGGTEAMEELLRRDPGLTAVFCASDEMAIGAFRTLRDAGRSVPGDVSVVGFDDHVASDALGLTTVRQPVSLMAAKAADRVLKRVGGAEDAVETIELETELIVRSTTAAPPRRKRSQKYVGIT